MKNKKNLKHIFLNKKGFTIIEVLIAIGVLSVGILGMATMQVTAIRGNDIADLLTTNSNWGINRIEQLMAMEYDDANLTGSVYTNTDTSLLNHLNTNPVTGLYQPVSGTDGLDNNRDGQIDEAGETGNRSIEWRVVEDYPILGSKWIRITVTQTRGTDQKSTSIIYYKIDNI